MTIKTKRKADKQYIASYMHGGDEWTLTFYATDDTDAKWKVENIKNSLRYDGELFAQIKLPWFSFGIFGRR